jgi:5-methylcytosine-specific restriction endonuclease McrA
MLNLSASLVRAVGGDRCCLPEEKLTLDHLKPKSRGGSNSLENLRLACFPCNNSRGNSLYPPQQPRSRTNQFLAN